MERDELLTLCDRYVRGRCSGGQPPVHLIVTSYRLGEISESEKNSLLAYVSDPEEEDVTGTWERGCADAFDFGLVGDAEPGLTAL